MSVSVRDYFFYSELRDHHMVKIKSSEAWYQQNQEQVGDYNAPNMNVAAKNLHTHTTWQHRAQKIYTITMVSSQ